MARMMADCRRFPSESNCSLVIIGEEEEVARVRAGLKSSLIMQEESTSARAGALASDWYYLGRVRSSEEVRAAVESLTPEKITAHLHRCPPGPFTIVTLGPQPLRVGRSLTAAASSNGKRKA